MSPKNITLRDGENYITLQSVLKIAGLIDTGGMAKWYLEENAVLVNKTRETRRGRKLYPSDVIEAGNETFLIK